MTARPPRRRPGRVARVATFVLLLAGGLTLLLFAVRLVAAAFGCAFSPFGYIGLPESYGWQAVLFAGLATGCVALLALAVEDGRDDVWLARGRGGVTVPASAIEVMLRDAARTHDDVVRADVDVRVRRGRPAATLRIDLRPLADGAAIGAELGDAARERLARVTGVADVHVKVRPHVLTVRQLPGRLP